jgi:hypothetical protein
VSQPPPEPILIGVYRLPSQLGLTAGCAGKSLRVDPGGINGRILLPELRWKGDEPELTTPSVAGWAARSVEALARSDGGWGGPQRYNPVRKTVQHMYLDAVALEITTRPDSFHFYDESHGLGVPDGPAIDALFGYIEGWWLKFGEWVELCTNQDTDPQSPLQTARFPGRGLALIGTDGKEASPPRFNNKIALVLREVNPLTVANISLIAKLVNERIEPSDSHELLRQGWAQLRRGHLRRSVIDAGTALELALATYNRAGPKINLGSLPTLGRYVKNKQIQRGAKLAANTDRDVVKLRNAAIHANRQPTGAEAEQALRIVRSVLDQLEPLPTGPWRPPPVRPQSRGGTGAR